VVDTDEFVFPVGYHDWPAQSRQFLMESQSDYFGVPMWDVFRHQQDRDINRNFQPVMQRRHGIRLGHFKTCIVRPTLIKTGQASFGVGCHALCWHLTMGMCAPWSVNLTSPWAGPWTGVHWSLADPCFCIKRRLEDRKHRLSERNLIHRYGRHCLKTEQQLIAELKAHENDPQIF
jgi:hypothetical protein